MIKSTLSAILLLIGSTAGAASSPYLCQDFAKEYEAVKLAQSTTDSFKASAGFLMGAYYATTDEPLDDQNTKGLAQFERDVARQCAEAPSVGFRSVVLMEASKLGKHEAAVTATNGDPEYQRIELTDFILDFDKLNGRRISVSGTLQIMGEMAMLGRGQFDMNMVFVETGTLPRASRKYLIEQCSRRGCGVTVRGKATSVMMNKGIVAEELVPD